MTIYVIYRHGSNSANQPMCDKAVVGTVVARDRAKALEAAWQWINCYANQTLSVEPASRVPKADFREAQRRRSEP